MLKVVSGIILALSAMLAINLSASAAPQPTELTKTGPFEGTFKGKVYGDKGTNAPLSLVLKHRGNQVEGNVFLGEGLYLDGGMCGAGYVPAGSQFATGETSAKKPGNFSAQSDFNISGFDVKLDIDGHISDDGKGLDAKAKIDLPWLCGRDPVISGTLFKTA